jgi:hypothetical protein
MGSEDGMKGSVR